MLLLAGALAAAGCEGDGSSVPTPVAATPDTVTFAHGVASGDVTSTGAVVWTRAEGASEVALEIREAGSGKVIIEDLGQTSAAADYTVKFHIDDLDPGTAYRYRLRAGASVSEEGAFTTAPDDSAPAAISFVFSGDSDGSRKPDGTAPYGEFDVLDAAAAEQGAFFLYLGDTIYSDRAPVATTLDGYRAKYRENRGYAALRRIFAAMPAYTVWDDHEVVNDFAGTTVDAGMFAAGRQAFREFMPIDDRVEPGRLYRSFRWGRDIELIIVDARSYRSESVSGACAIDGRSDPIPGAASAGAPDSLRAIRGFVGLPADAAPGCLEAMQDPARTLLGAEQKAWLKERLRESDATWKVIANSVPVQALLALPYDRWEGYAAERREVLEFIRDEGIANVVFLTTDFHANVFGPVRIDPFDVAAAPVAYEAIAGPIATATLQRDVVDVLGEAGAGVLGPFFEGVVGVDCAELDAYAYGLVSVTGGALTVVAKDAAGRVLCRADLEAK